MINFFWSRSPGKFVNKKTGVEAQLTGMGPNFLGTVREWYETLGETIVDVCNQHVRDGGAANLASAGSAILTCSKNVAIILECSVLYKLPLNYVDNTCQTCGRGDNISRDQTEENYGMWCRHKIVINNDLKDDILIGDFGTVTVLDMPSL